MRCPEDTDTPGSTKEGSIHDEDSRLWNDRFLGDFDFLQTRLNPLGTMTNLSTDLL